MEKKIGFLLKIWRDYRGFTQKSFAEKLGVSLTSVQSWESDLMKPKTNNFKKILNVLEITERDFHKGPLGKIEDEEEESVLDRMLPVFPFTVTNLPQHLWPEIGHSLNWANQYSPKEHFLVYVDMDTNIKKSFSEKIPFGSLVIIRKIHQHTPKPEGVAVLDKYLIQVPSKQIALFTDYQAAEGFYKEDFFILGKVIKINPRIPGMETMDF